MITYDPSTKKFLQSPPKEKVCYICSSNNFVDDHHIDEKRGKVSNETYPLCRRCHTTIHAYNGINWFDDDIINKAIFIYNKTQALYNYPLITRADIKRSKYWQKKHKVEKVMVFNPETSRFSQEVK